MIYRSHNCGELRAENIGERVLLAGWIARVRDLGGLLFLTLRDRYGRTQIFVDIDGDLTERAKKLHFEDVLQINGIVRARPDGMINPEMPTGEIEVVADELTILNTSITLPILVEDEEEPSEELRLRYRYLDLRKERMQTNLRLRHKALQSVRRFHDEAGFTEIETPFLIRSTPEGARDFIVPSRLHPASCYALPQSPQLYKQALMIGGVDRYFQIARCFRDEDMRRDRQPEFTQIDLEMSFVDEETIFPFVENMMTRLVKDTDGSSIQTPFPQMKYSEAISQYGSDAPDTRFELLIQRADDVFKESGFKAFEGILADSGAVYCICAPGKGSLSRKERSKLEDLAKEEGLAGLMSVPFNNGEFSGILAKLFSVDRQQDIANLLSANEGDLLMFAAGKPLATLESLGRVRRRLALEWDLIDDSKLDFVWVTDAPLFEQIDEGEGITAVHHPFTMPAEDDIDKLDSDPLNVKSRAYDLVLNGVEVATGSVRIHDQSLQERIFRIIGIDKAEAHRRFGFLLEALSYGAPPHAGIALGFDRLVMLIARESSIKDVIAFPKTNIASSPMDGSPAEMESDQLLELGLQLRPER